MKGDYIMYNFTEKEARTVLAVFGELCRKSDRELNTFLGSITIEEMKSLYWKLHYSPFCEKHGVKYEEMTEDDFIRAWEEEEERYRSWEED